MSVQKENFLDELRTASPLEATQILQDIELYDAKSSQEIIDEVYEQFASGENMTEEIVKPVFMSVVDGLLEATASGRAARKKGLTASRVLKECETFSYNETQDYGTNVDGYIEYKNARDIQCDTVNTGMTQEYSKENRTKYYENKPEMDLYKENRLLGEKMLVDEYTGKRNIYLKQDNMNLRYNDETYRKQAQPDHIVPLKQIHDRFSSNYALDDSDIKKIGNIEQNFAVTSAYLNQIKKEKSNEELIAYMEKKGIPLDEETCKNLRTLQKLAEKETDKAANKVVFANLLGKGTVDEKVISKQFEEKHGRKPSKEETAELKKILEKEKTKEIQKNLTNDAAKQAADYAVGNLILFIIKPLYFELSDSFKHGFEDGVQASSGKEAVQIRFGRVKKYVFENAAGFLGENTWEFVKGFVSSLFEGIIGLFVGVFKQVLKLLKEGIKIFSESAKVLFGKNAEKLSPAEKGDAIIKIIGGSAIAIAGIGIEAWLNSLGIGEPWSIILSTMLSGIAASLFMYLLNKADIFSVKAEKRHDRILEIFDERIKDIEEARNNFDIAAVELLQNQKLEFESISGDINSGLEENNILKINEGLYRMASFMNVDLPYSNTAEFCEYMDSEEVLVL